MIGGLIVIFAIVAMVMIHEGGHFLAAKAVGMKATEFFFGFGPRLWSVRRGETEYGVKALPLGGYVRIVGMNPYEEVAPEDQGRTYREKPFWAKAVVVLAGIVSHFVVAYLLFFLIFVALGVPDVDQPIPVVFNVVEELEDGSTSPAARAGLRPGDRILEIAGEPVGSWDEAVELITSRPGERVTLVVERDGERLSVTTRLATEEREGETVGFLGVAPDFVTTRLGPLAAAGRAGVTVADVSVRSVVALGRVVSPDTLGQYVEALTGGGRVDEEVRPLSPVGLVRVGAQAQQMGFDLVLVLVAIFNVFVGLFNLVPIYPFDGGHFAVAVYEKLTGREADVRKLYPVAAAVLVLLGFLFITALYLDIVGPVPSLQ